MVVMRDEEGSAVLASLCVRYRSYPQRMGNRTKLEPDLSWNLVLTTAASAQHWATLVLPCHKRRYFEISGLGTHPAIDTAAPSVSNTNEPQNSQTRQTRQNDIETLDQTD